MMTESATWATHPWVADGTQTIRFGVGVVAVAPAVDGQTYRELAQAVEGYGLDSLWVSDHPRWAPDCWTRLAVFAVATSRIRLGPLVCCVYYRSPALLARLGADVDRLSSGRLVLGMGAGWNEGEFRLLGVPFPPNRERLQTLTETVQAVRGLWGPEPFTLNGNYVKIENGNLVGGPIQQPYVPLVIGGAGEQITLRRVAEYADMCNIEARTAPTPEAVRHKYNVLRSHCADFGRPYESVVRSHWQNLVVLAATPRALADRLNALPPVYRELDIAINGYTPRQLIDYYRPLIRAGVQYIIVNLTQYTDVETVRLLAEQVMPALQT
jgi:alkanesulfonate monooxygenase SsuD/methylene tetrahydromethanopterin reductase-like flavin-dependent oxidoreductase (luciferase family)